MKGKIFVKNDSYFVSIGNKEYILHPIDEIMIKDLYESFDHPISRINNSNPTFRIIEGPENQKGFAKIV